MVLFLHFADVLTFIDDFSFTVSSSSYCSNCRALQSAFGRIRAITHFRKVDFSVSKTELIYWGTSMQYDSLSAPPPPPVALDDQLFHPSVKLRWLDYWFVPNLAFSAHFSRHLALFQAAFASMKHLSSGWKGISPHLATLLLTAWFSLSSPSAPISSPP